MINLPDLFGKYPANSTPPDTPNIYHDPKNMQKMPQMVLMGPLV